MSTKTAKNGRPRRSALGRYYEQLSAEERAALAAEVGIVVRYLYQVSTGVNGRRPSPKLSRRLHKATGIPLEQIRPDVFGEGR